MSTNLDDQTSASMPLSRTERKKQERLEKLLNTATLVFGEKGYDKTSLEDIAERMDMRGPSLYHYVKTKEDLFIQCADRIIKRNLKNLEEVKEAEGSPIQRLEKMYYVQILGQLDEFYPSHIPLFVTVTSREPNLIHQWYSPTGNDSAEVMAAKISKSFIKLIRD